MWPAWSSDDNGWSFNDLDGHIWEVMNMVAPVHLLYPGGEHERVWLEEVVHITKDGGRPLFSWGFEPLTGR
jgi:hypothetical protein